MNGGNRPSKSYHQKSLNRSGANALGVPDVLVAEICLNCSQKHGPRARSRRARQGPCRPDGEALRRQGSGENLRCESVEMVFVDQAAPGRSRKGHGGQ